MVSRITDSLALIFKTNVFLLGIVVLAYAAMSYSNYLDIYIYKGNINLYLSHAATTGAWYNINIMIPRLYVQYWRLVI